MSGEEDKRKNINADKITHRKAKKNRRTQTEEKQRKERKGKERKGKELL